MVIIPTKTNPVHSLAKVACGWLGWMLLALAPVVQADEATEPDLSQAQWIWSGDGAEQPNEDSCLFRKKFTLAVKPQQATIVLTADNGFDLYINGHYLAGESGREEAIWKSAERFRIEQYLLEGPNVIAVRAENLGGPGGLVAAVHVLLPNDGKLALATDDSWFTSRKPAPGWTESDHDDSLWKRAAALGKIGIQPWGKLDVSQQLSTLQRRKGGVEQFAKPGQDYDWPAGVVFVAGKAPVSSTPDAPQAKWPVDDSQAFFEYDTPAPSVLGHSLWALVPARPDAKPRLLLDAGKGLIGSPTCSFDGSEIIFSLAPAGEKYFKLFRIGADGQGLARLTSGPWHDYDPAVLPDGRIAFASTRIGSRDEYHGNTARSLFALSSDRREIHPLTYHIVADSKPTVMADGRIAFVRSDNFFERAKVETHIHAIHPDGTSGEVLLGPHRGQVAYDRPTGAEAHSSWLRNYGFGSPAALPDGRVACLSHFGPIVTALVTSAPTEPLAESYAELKAVDAAQSAAANATNGGLAALRGDRWDAAPLPSNVALFDISSLPDGRLLCSTRRGRALGILHPNSGQVVLLHASDTYDLHSVTYLGPRTPPPQLGSKVTASDQQAPDTSGYLLCRNIFDTKQTDGDWARVKAVRVLLGDPLTTRSARHPYDHIGVEGVELGTVPLAPDGSFHVRVPADRALALQAVDGEGRAVVNELSWIYVRPGEHRFCTGCHSRPQDAPPGNGALAAETAPIDLRPRGEPHRFRANNAANGGVLNLQFDRFREVASIDLFRQAALPEGTDSTELPPGRTAEVARLCEWLATGDSGKKESAADRLAIIRDRQAVPSLVAALGDREVLVRIRAALALSACGNRAAVGPLAEALVDSDAAVAQAVGLALEHLTGHREPFDPYRDPDSQATARQQWQAWLGANDWDAIERQLVARLGSPDPAVEHESIEALGHVGARPAAAALREYLETGGDASLISRLAAIRALGHLRDADAVPLLARILKENIVPAPFTSKESHEFGWAQQPVHLAGAAAEALGWIGTEAAQNHLIESFKQLGSFWYYTYRTGDHDWLMGCHSSIPHYRIAEALDALGSRVDAAVVAGLLQSVPIDPDRGLFFENDVYETVTARVVHRSGLARQVVETCLAVLGDTGAKRSEELVGAVTASPPAVSVGVLTPESRGAHLLSVVSLCREDAPRVRAALARYRQQPPSAQRSWVCFFLARTLGKLADEGSVAELLAALSQDRNEAGFGIPDPPNVFLHEAMTPLYRAAAADALGRIGAAEAAPLLLKIVGDYDNAMDVRHAAARALGRTAGPGQLSQLEDVARNYPEVATQRALWGACAAVRTRNHATARVAAGQK